MVLLGIPKQGNFRCLAGKRVMLTNGYAWAERTALSVRPVVDSSLPDMRKAIWALITGPPHLTMAVRLDHNVANMHVELFMPLFLQLASKQAGVGLSLPAVLLWHTVSATFNSIGMPCTSACMRES